MFIYGATRTSMAVVFGPDQEENEALERLQTVADAYSSSILEVVAFGS